nr:metallophosphoesterase [Candidatus Sigynarchaeota archaeon]
MKIHVLSDLHLEFGGIHIPPVDCDVTVIAGDIHLGQQALPLLEKLCRQGPVVYVLGNHEFYEHDFDAVLDFWKSCDLKNLVFLENRSAIIKKVRFVGATLWTDMNKRDKDTMKVARYSMNDYVLATKNGRVLMPEDTVELFDQSKAFIEQELSRHFNGPTVVVTHHLPTSRSIAPQYKDDPMNACFGSDLDQLILRHQPAAWIHGHTHVSFDYHIEKTRVVCNPRGYADSEPNPAFKRDLVIEI